MIALAKILHLGVVDQIINGTVVRFDYVSGLIQAHGLEDNYVLPLSHHQKNLSVPRLIVVSDPQVSGYVKDRIVHLEHMGSFGQSVEVAATVDLIGMAQKTLRSAAMAKKPTATSGLTFQPFN